MTFVAPPLTRPTAITQSVDPQGNNSTATVPQVDPRLHWLEPDVAPFISLLENKIQKSKPVRNYRHTWFKQYPYPNQVTSLGAVGAGTSTVTLAVGDGAYLAIDYSLMNIRTGEIVRVTTTPTNDSVATRRSIGSNGPFDIFDGDKWLILGPTNEDGAGMGPIRTVGNSEDYNFPEITRHPFGLTGRMLTTERWTGPAMEEEQRKAWHEHAKSLERKAFFGLREQALGTLGNGQNAMGGLRDFIRRNVWDLAGANITKTSFDDFAVEVGKYGRGGYLHGTATKGIFCGRQMAQVFIDWAEGKVLYRPTDRVVGMEVDVIQNASCKFNIFKCGTFDTIPGMENRAFIVDINEVSSAPYEGRSTSMLSDRQANDIDGKKFEFFTDQTLEVPMEEAHGMILNAGF